MNKYRAFSLFFTVFSITTWAQIAIGKTTINGSSTLLEFDDSPTNTKGIILPAVQSLATNTNGTLVFYKLDRRVKLRENNTWKNLSDQGDSSSLITNTSVETGTGVVIGSRTTTSNGVLVLESPDKALVLPKIANPHLTVANPYPGMICYDTVAKALAVYNGTEWNYWK